MSGIPCPACGAGNADGQRFCGACGAALEHTCATCGTANPARFRFCGSCGGSLHDDVVRVASGVEERRWATVLFADLSGFTSLSEREDPEDVRALIDRCMGSMGEIVEKFGGFVARVVGDELMALFGAPVAHDDDPDRAVRAALEMQRCAVEKAEEFGQLPLRVGVNTGDMMFAPVGPSGAREHTVMGDAVNTAKRLESAAPLGGVLVGQETYRATRASVRYEPVTPFAAKGKEEPLAAWRALETVADAGERPLSRVSMVGRDRELALLNTVWERVVAEGRAQLVTVVAPPGIGKSRLVREFADGLPEDAKVLFGRSLPYGESTGFGAFAEQVKQAAGIYETDPAPEARRKLADFVRSLVAAPQGDEIADHLAVLMGLGGEGEVGDRQPLFFSARRLVEAMGARSPTLLVFEDIHWADASLLDLVETLAGRVQEGAVLLLAMARPELVERRPGWGGASVPATSLNLDALTVADSRALAARLLPRVADEAVLDRLSDTAGGNPLFLEELAATFSERTSGVVESMPTSLKGIIAARLDALPATERRVLLDAAVVGKIFWRGVLESVAPGEPVWETLDSLCARDLVRRERTSRIEGDEEYLFKHMLIREVAYATVPKAVRRERHTQVARLIEDAARDRIDEHASLLAHHWRGAGDTERAIGYMIRAAEHASGAFAKGEAIALYDQVLELLPSDDVRRDGALLSRALAHAEVGDYQQAAGELDELIPRLDGRDLAEALFTRAMSAFWLFDVAGMRRFGEKLEVLADGLGDPASRALTVALLMEEASLTGDHDDALRLGAEALAIWPPGYRTKDHAFQYSLHGLTNYWLGNLDDAIELSLRGYEMGEDVYSLEALLTGGPHYALGLAGVGRYQEALEMFATVVSRGSDLEAVPRFTSRAMNMWAGTLFELGDVDGGREMWERAVEASERAAFPTSGVQARVDMLFADVATGEVGRAESAWPEVMDGAGALKGWHEWLVGGRMSAARAEIELAAGRADSAVEAAGVALENAERYKRLKYSVISRLVRAEAQLALGKAAEAVEDARKALSGAEHLRHPPLLRRSRHTLARALYATGDDAGAEAGWMDARRGVEEVAAGLEEPRRARFLSSPPVAEILTSSP